MTVLGERKPPPTLSFFSVVFARWQHYIRRRFALSYRRILHPGSMCCSGSPPKSNHL